MFSTAQDVTTVTPDMTLLTPDVTLMTSNITSNGEDVTIRPSATEISPNTTQDDPSLGITPSSTVTPLLRNSDNAQSSTNATDNAVNSPVPFSVIPTSNPEQPSSSDIVQSPAESIAPDPTMDVRSGSEGIISENVTQNLDSPAVPDAAGNVTDSAGIQQDNNTNIPAETKTPVQTHTQDSPNGTDSTELDMSIDPDRMVTNNLTELEITTQPFNASLSEETVTQSPHSNVTEISTTDLPMTSDSDTITQRVLSNETFSGNDTDVVTEPTDFNNTQALVTPNPEFDNMTMELPENQTYVEVTVPLPSDNDTSLETSTPGQQLNNNTQSVVSNVTDITDTGVTISDGLDNITQTDGNITDIISPSPTTASDIIDINVTTTLENVTQPILPVDNTTSDQLPQENITQIVENNTLTATTSLPVPDNITSVIQNITDPTSIDNVTHVDTGSPYTNVTDLDIVENVTSITTMDNLNQTYTTPGYDYVTSPDNLTVADENLTSIQGINETLANTTSSLDFNVSVTPYYNTTNTSPFTADETDLNENITLVTPRTIFDNVTQMYENTTVITSNFTEGFENSTQLGNGTSLEGTTIMYDNVAQNNNFTDTNMTETDSGMQNYTTPLPPILWNETTPVISNITEIDGNFTEGMDNNTVGNTTESVENVTNIDGNVTLETWNFTMEMTTLFPQNVTIIEPYTGNDTNVTDIFTTVMPSNFTDLENGTLFDNVTDVGNFTQGLSNVTTGYENVTSFYENATTSNLTDFTGNVTEMPSNLTVTSYTANFTIEMTTVRP